MGWRLQGTGYGLRVTVLGEIPLRAATRVATAE